MEKKICVFEGPFLTNSGYGYHALDLLRSLFKILPEDQWEIKTFATKWGATPFYTIDDERINNSIIKQRLDEIPDLHIQVTIPTEFQKRGKVSIGITAGTETSMCSPDFLLGCNKMDYVIVPSKFTKQVFIDSKYKIKDTEDTLLINKPIDVLFEGIDPTIYYKTKEIDKEINEELNMIPETYNFLSVGHWLSGRIGHDRKNIGMLIFVFMDTFKNMENAPGLILKTTLGSNSEIDKYELKKRIKKIANNFGAVKLPNVYILNGTISDNQMNSLYNHPKVSSFVSFTRGEGFFRPLLEFSTVCKPIAVSNWSGHLDFLPLGNAIHLPGELKPLDASSVWDKILIKESKWFEPDYKYASQKMLYMFENPGKYIEMSRKQANNTKNFTLDNMTERFKEILKKYELI